jgi:predicted nucleic acid-binding protein
MWIVLDAGPLGLLANPTRSGPAQAAQSWARAKIADGHHLVVAEISDYEVRRELLRANRAAAVARLDAICAGFGYAPITTSVMRDAAQLWANARNSGQPTAHDHALDGDVILAAQARTLPVGRDEPVVVATTNTGHLALYVAAEVWGDL